MPIDSLTVLLFGTFIKLALAVIFVAFRIADRRAGWYGWWAATLFIGCGASVLYIVRGASPDFIVIGIGNATAILAYGCAWQSARVFERRRPLWLPLCAAPGVWLMASLLPQFHTEGSLRVVLSSLILAPILAATAIEFWRGRSERLASRWAVIVLFTILALFFVARLPLLHLLPFPFGALPPRSGSVGIFNLFTLSHTLILSLLLVAMSKERFELEQRTRAQTDPLTGALNRRAFQVRGGRLLARHAHEHAPLSLLFIDLDNFKALNDRLGHAGGDDVLMRLVAKLNAGIRPTDFLFRIGGEEFCCLLPHTPAEQARGVAERIRRQIESATIQAGGVRVHTTVSIGVASTETFGYDLDALTRHADSAVYAAKRGGRNRVVVAAGLSDPVSFSAAAS